MKNLGLLLASICLLYFECYAQNTYRQEIERFAAQLGAVATIDSATHSLSYLRFPIGQPLQLAGTTPEQKAQTFISSYSRLFSNKTEGVAHLVKDIKRDVYGFEHVTLQQYYKQVPVFDGVLRFHFDKNGNLASLNGNHIMLSKLNLNPKITADEAQQNAIKYVTAQKEGVISANLKIGRSSLMIFQKGLAQGYKGTLHLVYEVEVKNDADVREFLYVDAHNGQLVEQFTGTHGIDRKLYETSVTPANLKWQESDGIAGQKFASLDQWQKSEIESAGHIYNLMKNSFGRTSYDGMDAPMTTIHNSPDVNCPNAIWNGLAANYCTGVASDDVVAHEWAHAYTEHTSGLIYAWQAGAINEAYSDIWGEVVDQLNNYFDLGEDQSIRTNCGSSARWQVGEQATAFGGILRDMWNPICRGQPGKMSDPEYWCYVLDEGGVHVNSGILNHAFALLTDGGYYNGQMIQGLGLTKSAHIFWNAQANHITSTTNFAMLANILETSLTELIGINLPKLSTELNGGGLSGVTISLEDLNELQKVIQVVEMRDSENCGFQPLFNPVSLLCKGAAPEYSFFYENFENGLTGWTVSAQSAYPTWSPLNWQVDNTPPGNRTGNVIVAKNHDGNCQNDIQYGLVNVASPPITIPGDAIGPFILAFDHFVSLEEGNDGGNVSYKIGAGIWQIVPKSAFTDNAYNTVLAANQKDAFSGGDQGSVISGWGQSRINLSLLGLLAGQTIQLRWDMSSDGCDGWDGWYVDDIRVYSCSIPTVQFVETNSLVNEGAANIVNSPPNGCLTYLEKPITIKINKAPSQPVTVTFNPPTGSASPGETQDYIITPNSVVLQQGELSKDVIVRINNDAYVEGNETISLSYSISNPPGGDASLEFLNQEHTLTIADNDVDPSLGTEQVHLISADFNNNTIPGNWTVFGCCGYPDTWGVVYWGPGWSLDGTRLLAIGSEQDDIDKAIETAPFNSSGMSSITLSFLEIFDVLNGGFNEQAMVDVWDGAQWQNILTENEATGSSGTWNAPAVRNISIPANYANPNMKIRFRYVADHDHLWGIDNVKVTGVVQDEIQTSVSQIQDTQYLGPNATVNYRDPDSGKLLAKIKNLTSHDYGCTSVQIDRAGADETVWFGTHKITTKTFKVTPTHDLSNGNYEITLYYKASELPNFNGADIKSMGRSQGTIQLGTPANSILAPTQLSMFNNDYAYTAIFNSNFGGGFGLSDVSDGDVLPVILSGFRGKYSQEGNVLAWETNTEFNSDHFEVERSVNGKTFDTITRIRASGNSTTVKQYSFIDSKCETGINYYRLKLVDADKSYSYSRIIVVAAPEQYRSEVYPNPVSTLLSIKSSGKNPGPTRIEIINAAGQVVLRHEKVKTQHGEVQLDVSKIPAGLYQVLISSSKSYRSFPIVKLP